MGVRIHFLNVGAGDCTIIEHPSGRVSMIDINNARAFDEGSRQALIRESNLDPFRVLLLSQIGGLDRFLQESYDIQLTDPIEYYKTMIGSKDIFRFILTHPDMDHMTGLYRIRQEQLNGNFSDIINFWDTIHSIDKLGEWDKYDKRDWDEYQRLRSSNTAPTVLHLPAGATGQYYNQDDYGGDGDRIDIWSPTAELVSQANTSGQPNILSYVLAVEHPTFLGKRVIFGGDAEADSTWETIKDFLDSKGLTNNLSVAVLKASHHGRKSGYHQELVKSLSPLYTIVSTGKKDEHDASDLYRQYTQRNVLSTRYWGNILVNISDNGTVHVYTEKNRRGSLQWDPVTGYWKLSESVGASIF